MVCAIRDHRLGSETLIRDLVIGIDSESQYFSLGSEKNFEIVDQNIQILGSDVNRGQIFRIWFLDIMCVHM